MASITVNDNNESVVMFDQFLEMFTSPKDLFQRIDLSKMVEIDPFGTGEDGTELYRPPGETADVRLVDVGVVLGIPRAHHAMVLKYFCAPGQKGLKPSDLKRFYRDFQAIDMGRSGGVFVVGAGGGFLRRRML